MNKCFHFLTSYALEDNDMNALHDAWVSLDEANVYTSSDSINSNVDITSDSLNDNESMDNDSLDLMNIDLMKYTNASLFVPKSYFTFNQASYSFLYPMHIFTIPVFIFVHR